MLFGGVAALTTPGFAQGQAPVALGQPLPTLQLKNQQDQPWQITPVTELVLFAAGRQATSLVQAALAGQARDALSRRNAVYLADMSKMPGFITRTFALPALRSMVYPIGVSLEEATLAAWPRQTDAVTLLALDNGLLKRITYARTEAELRAALGP
jgi:hypothetical protein